jgi:predicted nuclease of predicted toxin-antitoxin system
MRFLADMGVSQRVVEWLRAESHDVVHLRDEGLQTLPNGEIYKKARVEGRIVLTFDLDFGEIVAESAGSIVSVILFRLRNARAARVMQALGEVLARCQKLTSKMAQSWSSKMVGTEFAGFRLAASPSRSPTRCGHY